MPSTIYHGGGCCGMRHIAGFGSSNNAQERESFLASLRNVPIGRLAEVALIDSQRSWIPQLEAQGFVKTLRFRNGNTGNYVTLFHRHQAAGVIGAAQNEFQIFGRDGIPVNVPDAPAVAPGAAVGGFDFGSRVRYESHGSRLNGQTAVVEHAEAGRRRIRWDRDGLLSGWLVVGNLRALPVADAQPGPAQPVPEPARQEPREVARFFHCVYRDGRRGAGYDTLEAAVEANPRVRRVDAQVIMSDGNRRWEERVNG